MNLPFSDAEKATLIGSQARAFPFSAFYETLADNICASPSHLIRQSASAGFSIRSVSILMISAAILTSFSSLSVFSSSLYYLVQGASDHKFRIG